MHLFLGDYYANMKDSIQKGRQPIVKGENHLNAKLNDADVVQIRELYKGGFTQLKIAKAFGIGQDGVSRIVNRKLWSHI
jgi:DNA invertase Pin-like site-specific DNA recombinase